MNPKVETIVLFGAIILMVISGIYMGYKIGLGKGAEMICDNYQEKVYLWLSDNKPHCGKPEGFDPIINSDLLEPNIKLNLNLSEVK